MTALQPRMTARIAVAVHFDCIQPDSDPKWGCSRPMVQATISAADHQMSEWEQELVQIVSRLLNEDPSICSIPALLDHPQVAPLARGLLETRIALRHCHDLKVSSCGSTISLLNPPLASGLEDPQASLCQVPEKLSESRWDPNGPRCSLCSTEFTLLFRRHHCRYCGLCVCGQCSSTIGAPLLARMCLECMSGLQKGHQPRALAFSPEELWKHVDQAQLPLESFAAVDRMVALSGDLQSWMCFHSHDSSLRLFKAVNNHGMSCSFKAEIKLKGIPPGIAMEVLTDTVARGRWDPFTSECRVLQNTNGVEQILLCTSPHGVERVQLRTALKRVVLARTPRNLVHIVMLQDSSHPAAPGATSEAGHTTGYIIQEWFEGGTGADSVLIRISQSKSVNNEGLNNESVFRKVFPQWCAAYQAACVDHRDFCQERNAWHNPGQADMAQYSHLDLEDSKNKTLL